MQPTLPSSDNQVLHTLLFQGKTAACCNGTTEMQGDGSAPVTLARVSPPGTAGDHTAPGDTLVPPQELQRKGLAQRPTHAPTDWRPKTGVTEGVALGKLGS